MSKKHHFDTFLRAANNVTRYFRGRNRGVEVGTKLLRSLISTLLRPAGWFETLPCLANLNNVVFLNQLNESLYYYNNLCTTIH